MTKADNYRRLRRLRERRGVELVDKIVAGEDVAANLIVLEDL